ncbi:FGGY-family carbohydrate kinase [soil metagenome]
MARASSDDGPLWVGLDVGTQSARALVVGEAGRVAASGSQSLDSRRDGARHEQDPERWWRAVAGACRVALRDLAPERVQGVAVCATSGTIVLVDRAGAPLTPGYMYDDARADDEARRINAIGAPVPVGATWGLPKLVWALQAWPEQVAAGARLAHQADVVTRRLTGHDVPADCSHALKSGYDVVAGSWPHALLEQLGVPEGMLPEVVRCGSSLGVVCDEASRTTGLASGTPLIAGMTDGCAGQLAAGALGDGQWNSVLGTTLVLKGVCSEPIGDPAGVLYCHRAPDGGWLPGGASSSGAGVLSARFGGRDLDSLGRRAAAQLPSGVLAYPLASRGERFPFAAPQAEAFLLGEPAGEDEHYAALLQGLAFVERLCFDYVDLLGAPTDGQLSFTGGATRSRVWCQLRADVLGRPVALVEQAESAFGMAVLAAATTAQRRVADVAAEMVRVDDIVEPRAQQAERLGATFERFVDELEQRGWLGPALAAHARSR